MIMWMIFFTSLFWVLGKTRRVWENNAIDNTNKPIHDLSSELFLKIWKWWNWEIERKNNWMEFWRKKDTSQKLSTEKLKWAEDNKEKLFQEMVSVVKASRLIGTRQEKMRSRPDMTVLKDGNFITNQWPIAALSHPQKWVWTWIFLRS